VAEVDGVISPEEEKCLWEDTAVEGTEVADRRVDVEGRAENFAPMAEVGMLPPAAATLLPLFGRWLTTCSDV